MSPRLPMLLVMLGLSLTFTDPAISQPPPKKPLLVVLSKEARTAFETGQKLATLGEHGAALPHFQRAHALSPDPRLLPWIARSLRAIGKHARAYHAIEVYLKDTAGGPADKERKEAEEIKAELRTKLAWLKLTSPVEGAVVFVDGEVVGHTPMSPVLVEKGIRSVRVTRDQHRPFEKKDLLVEGDEVSLAVELEKEPIPLGVALSGPALEAYEAGRVLFLDGDYASALVKFRAAHEASGDARLLWNMAVCEKNRRRYARVLALVERYLAEGTSVTTSQDRREAEELLKIVQGFVTPLRVETSEAGATVLVDEEEIGKTPMDKPVLIDMGSRKIRITKAGFVDFSVQQTISGAEPVTIQAELVALKREGKLVVTAGPLDTISLDGQIVGQGYWEGTLSSGTHSLLVTRKGMRSHQTDVAIEDNETRRVQVTLEAEPSRSSTWLWVGGGVLTAAGLGLGAYYLLRPETIPAPPPQVGTMPPGSVQLPLLPGHRASGGPGTFLSPTLTWGFR
jgi:tetratricopeptide (TPR) repeat protein